MSLIFAQSFSSAGKASDTVVVFKAEEIQDHPQVKLDIGGLYLMALLCGSDYSEVCL